MFFDSVYQILYTAFLTNSIDKIVYKQWVNKNNRFEFERTELMVSEYLDKLKFLFLDNFIEHDYIAKSQSDFVKTRKQNLKDDEVMVLMDFAENYSCVIQDEIQSHHWNHTQVTIHPFVIYKKENDEVSHRSFVIISDSLQHDVYAV